MYTLKMFLNNEWISIRNEFINIELSDGIDQLESVKPTQNITLLQSSRLDPFKHTQFNEATCLNGTEGFLLNKPEIKFFKNSDLLFYGYVDDFKYNDPITGKIQIIANSIYDKLDISYFNSNVNLYTILSDNNIDYETYTSLTDNIVIDDIIIENDFIEKIIEIIRPFNIYMDMRTDKLKFYEVSNDPVYIENYNIKNIKRTNVNINKKKIIFNNTYTTDVGLESQVYNTLYNATENTTLNITGSFLTRLIIDGVSYDEPGVYDETDYKINFNRHSINILFKINKECLIIAYGKNVEEYTNVIKYNSYSNNLFINSNLNIEKDDFINILENNKQYWDINKNSIQFEIKGVNFKTFDVLKIVIPSHHINNIMIVRKVINIYPKNMQILELYNTGSDQQITESMQKIQVVKSSEDLLNIIIDKQVKMNAILDGQLNVVKTTEDGITEDTNGTFYKIEIFKSDSYVSYNNNSNTQVNIKYQDEDILIPICDSTYTNSISQDILDSLVANKYDTFYIFYDKVNHTTNVLFLYKTKLYAFYINNFDKTSRDTITIEGIDTTDVVLVNESNYNDLLNFIYVQKITLET